MRRVLAACLLATFALAGCARNAALEVRMTLGVGGPDDRPFARVAARPATEDWPFEEPWAVESIVFDLAEDACEGEDPPCNVHFSVLTGQVHVEAMRLRVTFCRERDCLEEDGAADPPELWFELERPFHRGEITRWDPAAVPFVRLPRGAPQPVGLPAEPIVVPRCQVEGCYDEVVPVDAANGYCREMGAVHFCER